MNELCQNCNKNEATESWGGEASQTELARNPSLVQRWCKKCVLTYQLSYAERIASYIPKIKEELAALS